VKFHLLSGFLEAQKYGGFEEYANKALHHDSRPGSGASVPDPLSNRSNKPTILHDKCAITEPGQVLIVRYDDKGLTKVFPEL
jgi:hypothetical protein